MTPGFVNRRVVSVTRQRMLEVPVVALQGPRAVGKSTVLTQLAGECGGVVVDLDDRAVLDLVAASPSDFVMGEDPVFVDEYQRVPDLLQAIKAELNKRHAPGRFVLTGSTSFDTLPRGTQALTGRIQFLEVMPFSQGEIGGFSEDFIEAAFAGPDMFSRPMMSDTSFLDYVERVCQGGLPLAVGVSPPARGRWFEAYVASTVSRDVPELSRLRQPEALRQLLVRLAAQTGQLLNVSKAAESAGVEGRTADAYVQRLADLFLIRRLPAWGRTLRARTGRTAKVHVVDSGLAAHLLGLSPAKLARPDPAARTEFGHLLETFVVGEVLKQISWYQEATAVGHWRSHDGQEVDLVVERHDGAVIGFEVKAARETKASDLAGLKVLRDSLGSAFLAGFVLTTGERGGRIDDRLFTLPVDTLWRPIDL